MVNEDVDQDMRDWEETYGGSDGNFKDDDAIEKDAAATDTGCHGDADAEKVHNNGADAEKEKEVIDVEAEEEKKRKPMTSRSAMWDHFTKIYDKGNMLIKGKCKYCTNEIAAHPVHNGTSALRKHFNTCKKNPHRVSDDAKQGVLSATPGSSVGTWKFDPDLLRSAFAEFVIEDEVPFGFGEKPGFRKLMSVACPRFIIPSRRTCTRDTMQLYFEQKSKLKMFFQEHCNRVCLTTDGWTSQQQDNYMTVTAHFIDKNWCLHKKIISFFMVKGNKGDDIGKHLHKVLLEWGLDKVMIVTVDNASANDSGVTYLRRQMNSVNTSIA